MKRNVLTALIMATTGMTAGMAASASEVQQIDWSQVPTTPVTLFYPGQASHEWVMSDAHKRGAQAVANGRDCVYCHDDAYQRDMGEHIVKGGPLEPTPIAGKNGTIDLKVQAAFD